ncbi:MAG: methylmalonyl-CoA epimerase [Propionibacteriales bacterium]|nr:methylmalonyl-CoA epimerase [Propionibacteriales bacterium]
MRIHHIGWAVSSLGEHHDHFAGQLGLPYEGVEKFPTLSVAFYDAGSCLIELLEATDPSDDVAHFVRRRGEGIHHLAYVVDDVAEALREAGVRGLRLIDHRPRPGARGTQIGFVDPQRPDGVLVEYVQLPPDPSPFSTSATNGEM